MKVLIIEDNEELANSIQRFLAHEGYVCELSYTCEEAREKLTLYSYDCIILDIMLPDTNGVQLCREFRSLSNVPIMIVSAKNEVSERVNALLSGADDYLCKPFSMQELKARIGAALRRYKPAAAANETAAALEARQSGLELDPQKRLVLVEGRPVETTFSEFELMRLLFEHPGRVFTRDELISMLRGVDSYVNDRAIDVHITNLRKKIESNPKEPQYIKTVWGVGYKLVLD